MMSFAAGLATSPPKASNPDRRLVVVSLILYGIFLTLTILLPVAEIVSRSFRNRDGQFIGFENWASYFQTPSLVQSAQHSIFVASVTTFIVLSIGFLYAYALCRTCLPGRPFFKFMAMAPLLMPGLLKAVSLIYWFGNKGILKGALLGTSIYGPLGIIMASSLWTLPHVILILSASLMLSDARLYEASASLKAGSARTFLTVTLPGIRFGLISAGIFVFTRVLTDFGIPKVIGGNYNVLATDIYKEVIGQQNFEMGAVASIVLLIPAALAFVIDRAISGKIHSGMNARSVAYDPKRYWPRDIAFFLLCLAVSVLMLATIGMGQMAALFKFWPYNLSLTIDHYFFDMQGVGWDSFANSILFSFAVATLGTCLTFVGAYLVEKPQTDKGLRSFINAMALTPMAIPGLVLGLGYLLFINRPGNPLGFLYGTLAILVLNTVTHYYTIAHLTARTALQQIDREFESVAASLKIPLWRNFLRVTAPICAPAILDIWIYLFLNAMTTVSGVIFLYGIHSTLASLAVIHMDEAGRLASAAAMGTLIMYACVMARLVHYVISQFIFRWTQRWRGFGPS